MAKGQARFQWEDEDFMENKDKKHVLRRKRSAEERNKKKKASKIRQGIDRYYTVRQANNEGDITQNNDEDEFDNPSYH
ncbi:MAG: hypothetical protein PUP46_06265 [Endozoicomonas sp. (ex Botrylloides leachii)]|nr:hypothetical protein [Endozoicomonas sp. (ex Botrylloides leachii)]